jgi:hypothetical protein
MVFTMMGKVADHAVALLGELMHDYDRAPSEQINDICDLLLILDDLEEVDSAGVKGVRAKIDSRIGALENLISQVAAQRYAQKWDKRADNLGLALYETAKWIEKQAKTLDKRYPVKLLEYVAPGCEGAVSLILVYAIVDLISCR